MLLDMQFPHKLLCVITPATGRRERRAHMTGGQKFHSQTFGFNTKLLSMTR